MSQETPPGESVEPHSLFNRIDGCCDHFEKRLQAGERPRIEEFLGSAMGEEKRALLHRLLRLEFEYRRKRGEVPEPEDYLRRFPGEEEVILQEFSQAETVPPSEATVLAATPAPREAGFPFEILKTLGRGGMGVVYKARDLKLNRLVALKMILAGAHADPGELARFRTEAKAIASL